MGDSHVGLQARLMSQALRKITGALSNSGTTAIFINQLREKIGVMFGCLSYGTRVTLADGSQEKIGKIVNQKLPVEVLSYDPERGEIVPKKVVNWFDNGPTEQFLQITTARPGGNGRAQMGLTANHLVRTPGGWREAGELVSGDRVLLSQPHRLGPQQWQVVLGGLMGDAALSPSRIQGSLGTRFRMGHGAKQTAYLDWKASLFGNIGQCRSTNAKGAEFVDLTPLPELAEVRQAVYLGDGHKHLSWEYLKALTPLSLAIWYCDDGSFQVRAKGVQERTRDGSGRSEICVQAMSPGSRQRLVDHLAGTFDLHPRLALRGARRQSVLTFGKDETAKLHELIAPYVHPSMQYKLLERFRGRFAVEPEFVEPTLLPVPAPVLEVKVKPHTQSMHRFDIEVEGSHNYLADGVIVHNSPETTTGGRALKFYASVRLDVRRIETLKDGTDMVGNRTRVKVVKNKCAPPFKQAEFDILYGIGISREGSLIDVGVEQSIIRKSGAWYTYEGDQLGQGKENARKFLRDNPDVAAEVEKRIKERLGIGAVLDRGRATAGPGRLLRPVAQLPPDGNAEGDNAHPDRSTPPGPVRVARLDALPTAADGAGTRPVARFDAIGPGRRAGAGTGENADARVVGFDELGKARRRREAGEAPRRTGARRERRRRSHDPEARAEGVGLAPDTSGAAGEPGTAGPAAGRRADTVRRPGRDRGAESGRGLEADGDSGDTSGIGDASGHAEAGVPPDRPLPSDRPLPRGRRRRAAGRPERGAPVDRGAPDQEAEPPADPMAIAREICLQLLTDRARTRQELAHALARKGVPAEAVASVFEPLRRGRPHRRRRVRRAVGAHRGTAIAGWAAGRSPSSCAARASRTRSAREALAEIDTESEDRRARELVDRKLRSIAVDTADRRATAARRLVGMLARKGYCAGTAYRVVREALAERGAEVDEWNADPTDE